MDTENDIGWHFGLHVFRHIDSSMYEHGNDDDDERFSTEIKLPPKRAPNVTTYWATRSLNVFGRRMIAVLFLIVIEFLAAYSSEFAGYPRIVPFGAIFRQFGEDETMGAVMYAQDSRNINETTKFFPISVTTEILKEREKDDSWKIRELICKLAKNGFYILTASADHPSYQTFASASRALQLPLINWALPPTDHQSPFEISIRPSTHALAGDVIMAKQWSNVIYIYDGPDELANLRRLIKYLSGKNYSLNVQMTKLPNKNEDLNNFFKKVHSNKKLIRRIVMDVSNSTKLKEVITALKQETSTNVTERFHYFVVSFDVSESQIETFKSNYINITAIQIFNRLNEVYIKFLNRWQKEKHSRYWGSGKREITPEAAFAYDGIMVALNALDKSPQKTPDDDVFANVFRTEQMYNGGFRGIYCIPSEDNYQTDRPFMPFLQGKKVAARLRKVQIRGLTGDIEFDEHGFRKNFYVNILELEFSGRYGTVSSFTKMLWRDGVGLLTHNARISYERTHEKAFGYKKKYTIITVLADPFVMKTPESDKLPSDKKLEGFAIDLVELLAQKIENFDYEVVLSPGNKFGSADINGNWDGMVGELLTGRADLAVASLTITRARQRVVDFSKPFLTTGLSIMIRKPEPTEFSIFSFMQPLSNEVWMYIIFAYVGISVVIFLVSRFSPYEWRVEETCQGTFTISNDFSVYNCLWFTLSAFMQQGIDILPRSVSGRIASSAWWFFTMIIVSSYTANLAAFLTLEKMSTPIESAEDLAKQTKIKYGIQANGSTELFFKESTVQVYQRMYQFMQSQTPPAMVNSYDDGIKRVRGSITGRYAFILEETTNNYINIRPPCDTMKVGGSNLNSVGFGVATPFGSALKARINLAILELQEMGELNKLERRWWYEKNGDACIKMAVATKEGQNTSLTQAKVAGIFYILIGGMVVAIIAAFAEFVYRSRLEARKTKKSFSNSLWANLTLSLRGEKDRGLFT